MRNGYVDPYVVCPLYSREESNEVRKIYCEGYKDGVYVHLYFRKKGLKKAHKTNYCKNANAYHKCPLYQGISEYQKENDDEK